MIKGIIQNPQIGKSYKIVLADDSTRCVVFKGFGDYMAQRWLCVESKEIISELPPYKGYEDV